MLQHAEKQAPHISNCTEISSRCCVEGLMRSIKLGLDIHPGSK
jgi:hypothetical protein